MVVTANTANATRDEMSVARVLALHKKRCSREISMTLPPAFGDLTVIKIDLCINSETAPTMRVMGSQFISTTGVRFFVKAVLGYNL